MKLSFFFFSTIFQNWRPMTRGEFRKAMDHAWEMWAEQEATGDVAVPEEFRGAALLLVLGDDRPHVEVKVSEFDRQNMGEILGPNPGPAYSYYGCHVLRLISRADAYQRELLRMVYPDHVQAVEQWEREGR